MATTFRCGRDVVEGQPLDQKRYMKAGTLKSYRGSNLSVPEFGFGQTLFPHPWIKEYCITVV